MSRIITLTAALLVALATVLVVPLLPADAAGERVVIDFEGLAEGSIVSQVSIGDGMSGQPVTGTVSIAGWRDGARGTQRAMVFDATCAPWHNRFGCSGQDSDLFFPDRGNILIVSEDLDGSDPDDDTNAGFSLDFASFGPVTVESIGILDTNSQTAVVTLTRGDGSTEVREVGGTGDGSSTDVTFSTEQVVAMEIDLNGAGAIDDIVLVVGAAPSPSTTTTTTAPVTSTTVATTTTTTAPAATSTTTIPTSTTTTVPLVTDGLAVAPFIDGVLAGTAPGPDLVPGSEVLVTYEVTNTSGVVAWALYVRQDGIGRITCPDRTLDPGETVLCETTLTVPTEAFSELVTAKAWPESGEIIGQALLAFTGQGNAKAPEFVNIAAGKPATQADTNGWDVATPPSLAVDGNRDGDHDGGSVAMTYRVSDAWWEVDLGDVHDIDHVTLWNRTDCCSDRLRDFYVFVSDEPFDVKDIKNTLTQEGVTAIFEPGPAGRRIDIPVDRSGRYIRVQLSYDDAVLQLAEVEVMAAAATPVVVEPTAPPVLDLRVLPSDAAPAPGDEVTFTYRATNPGGEDLWALYVWHEGVGAATCPDRSLAPGETVECTATTVVSTGRHVEPVTAQAWDDEGVEAVETVSVEYSVGSDGAAGPALELDLLLDGSPATEPGPTVGFGSEMAWSYRIRNTGSVQLWALYLTHEGIGSIECPTRALAPGDEVVCERTAPAGSGGHADLVTASAWDDDGTRAGDVAVAAYRSDVAADTLSVALEARVAGERADDAPGPVVPRDGTIPMTFDVTNTGSSDLWGLWVNAPGFGTAVCPDRHVSPGETVTCSLDPPALPGLYSTVARAVAYDDADGEVESSDPLHVFVPAGTGAAVHLDVLVDGLNGDRHAGPRIAEGELMTFSYLVSNEGTVPLTDVSVVDGAHGAISCPTSTVEPGTTLVCTLRKTARLIRTQFDTTVTARAGTITVSDTERLYYHVKPYGREDELLLEVTIDGRDADTGPGPTLEAGTTARIRYVLTNNARNATMWSAEILDPRVPAGAMSCSGGPTLGHYQSMICSATIRVEPGSWSNLVVGHAWSNNGPRLDASDRIHYYGVS